MKSVVLITGFFCFNKTLQFDSFTSPECYCLYFSIFGIVIL